MLIEVDLRQRRRMCHSPYEGSSDGLLDGKGSEMAILLIKHLIKHQTAGQSGTYMLWPRYGIWCAHIHCNECRHTYSSLTPQ
jgi:hypothetical protein